MTEKQRIYFESKRHQWTDAELSYLRANYADMPCCDMKEVLGLNESTISKKARELGLQKSRDFYSRMQSRIVRGYKNERYKNYVKHE